MDTMPKLYLNGTALKGYDYEAQMDITGEKLYNLVVGGEISPINENGEYLLKEPLFALRKLDLFLQIIPHKKSFLEIEPGRFESITHYYEDGLIDAIVYNTMYDPKTGKTIGHAKQLQNSGINTKYLYIYEHYKTKVILWLREQLYTIPISIEHDLKFESEVEFVELTIKGKVQKLPIIYRHRDKNGIIKSISLLGCRFPFTEGDAPFVPPEIMRKMPLLHYKLAKTANQPDAVLIEIAKQGLQDVGYNGPMPAISSVDAMKKVKHYGSQRANDREKATGAAYDKIHDQLINMPELPPYHWNGKLYREDFLAYLEKNTTTGKFHKTIALNKWKSFKEEVGGKRIGTGRKP